jgi:hypothetical protein
MDNIDLVWQDPPGCYQCVQMPRLCVWPLRGLDQNGVLELDFEGGLKHADPAVRITFEGFAEADEQVIRWSAVPDYIKWCWEQATRET